jgi:hypothetical protein
LIEFLQVAGIHHLLGPTADNHTPTCPLELINSIYFKRNHGIPECATEPAVWVSPNHHRVGINEIVQGHDHRRQVDRFTLYGWLIVVPADFVMSRDMLHGVKERAERAVPLQRE